MTPKIEIVARNMRLTDNLKDYIDKKVAKLARHLQEIEEANAASSAGSSSPSPGNAISGKPKSRTPPRRASRRNWVTAASERQKPPYDFLSIGLLPSDRAVLHERIARRFDEMLRAGLDDEVRNLRAKYALNLNLPSMRCVGYRQTWEAQEGIIPHKELRDRGSSRHASWPSARSPG